MLGSLAKLLESLRADEVKIFDENINHDIVKDILAILMVHIIKADKKTTEKENEKILGFFQAEFNMTKSETHELFASVVEVIDELEMYTEKLNIVLADDLITKAKIIRHLNNLIICDGCTDEEYRVFETIRDALL